jgi:hypothetical protein
MDVLHYVSQLVYMSQETLEGQCSFPNDMIVYNTNISTIKYTPTTNSKAKET